MDKKTNIKDIISMAGGLDYINPKDIPSIDLYMDQLTTFMEDQLGKNRRNDEDKVMTKTMINNYTKNNLLPSPNKKRYSKQHLILLIYIYYLKNMLSINDIQTLLQPLIDGYFNANKDGKDISDIYAHLYEHLSQHYGDIIKDIVRTANKADAMYDPENDSYLHDLSMISLLSVDIYAKKKYVEHLVDKRYGDSCAGRANRMSESNGAAVYDSLDLDRENSSLFHVVSDNVPWIGVVKMLLQISHRLWLVLNSFL